MYSAPLPAFPTLPLLLLGMLGMLSDQVCAAAGPDANHIIPADLGPVQVIEPSRSSDAGPTGVTHYEDIFLTYDDYRHLKTRPLLHLDDGGVKELKPQIMLYSSFLDTRPLYYKQPAVLRMLVLYKRPPSGPQLPPVYCKYMVPGDDRYFVSKAHGPLRLAANDPSGYAYEDGVYTCNTTISSVEALEAAAVGGHSVQVPGFSTLVATPEQVPVHLGWVHVTITPLVHASPQVNQVLNTGRKTEGPSLTPDEYHSGEGEVAVCTGPLYGLDHHAGVLAQWTEFNKIMGAAKILIYNFNPGPATQHYLRFYEEHGVYEVFEYYLSKRLLRDVSAAKQGAN